MARKTTLDLTEGPILRGLLLFAFPLMLNSLVNTLYSTADTVMMGRFAGTNAMAAVGASNHPVTLLVNFFGGLALGVNVICGNLRGGRKQKELSECMHTCVLLGLISGVLVTILGFTVTRPLLQAMDTPSEILDDAVLYMSVRLAFGPVWLLETFCTYIFYAHGETRLPMFTSLVSGLVNVALNAVFVVGFGMGVEGVALATGASHVIKAVVLCAVLFSPKGIYQLSFRKLRLRLQYVSQVLSVGLPTGLNNIVFSVSNVVLQSCVNSFGTLVVAGNTAADSVIAYVLLILQSFGSATLSATAQCYGAHNLKRVDAIVKKALLGVICLIVLIDIPITVFGKQLLMLFDGNPEVAEMGYPKLMFSSWGYIINAGFTVYGSALRGVRKATVALLCNVSGTILPRLLWVWFIVPIMPSPTMLYMIYPISWSITATIMISAYYYNRKKLDQEAL